MKKEIIFSGGLGNQMFQYAFFLSLKEQGFVLSMNTSLYDVVKMHNGFELDKIFKLEDSIKKHTIINKYWIRFLKRFKPIQIVYSDRPYVYCEDVYICKQKYIMGDWISESYFKNIASKIRKVFQFIDIENKNKSLANKMNSENSVSLHIRRGDYLNLPNYNVCDEKYYTQAIEYFIDNIESPIFYVFSNDPDWCEGFMKQFKVKFQIINWNQGIKSYQDMFLMTQCKHNIIANSTFSWWGAWLNSNVAKIVVSPKFWFKNNELNANCNNWILI